MKFKMNKLASALATTLIVVALALNHATAQQEHGKQSSGRGVADSAIYLVVEEGFVIPAQPLASLGAGALLAERLTANKSVELFGVGAREAVVFRLDGGSARFEASGSRVLRSTVGAGIVELPPIKAGSANEEGVVKILLDGQEIIEGIPLVTVPVGTIGELARYRADNEAAFLFLTEHAAVIDASKLTNLPDESVAEPISLDGSPVPEEVRRSINSFS